MSTSSGESHTRPRGLVLAGLGVLWVVFVVAIGSGKGSSLAGSYGYLANVTNATGVDPFDAAALGAVGADGFVTIGPGVAAATPAVPALIPTIEPKLRIPAIPIRIQLGSQE